MTIGECRQANPERTLAYDLSSFGEMGAHYSRVCREIGNPKTVAPGGKMKPAVSIGLLGAR